MGLTSRVNGGEEFIAFSNRTVSDNTMDQIQAETREHKISLYAAAYNPNDDNGAAELGGNNTQEAPIGDFTMPLLFFAAFYLLRTRFKLKFGKW